MPPQKPSSDHSASHQPARTEAVDYELASVPIGPSTRAFVTESDPDGGIFYRFGRRRTQFLRLPADYGQQRLAVMDMVNAVAFVEPAGNRLIALAGLMRQGTRLILMGRRWGEWIDEDGVWHRDQQIIDRLYEWLMPVLINEDRCMLAVDFVVNVHMHEVFHDEVVACFRGNGVYHTIKMYFDFPGGVFQHCRINLHDEHSHRVRRHFILKQFPFQWDVAERICQELTPDIRAAGAHRRIRAASGAQDADSEPNQPAAPRPSPGSQRQPLRPKVPTSEHLSTHEMLNLVSTETDAARRWAIIEANLLQNRPERTYPLLLRYPDQIAERTSNWSPARLRSLFSTQPSAVMIGIMERWSVNQVLAVCEDHPDRQNIQNWLREREVERLLELDARHSPGSAEQARAILGVDRHADPPVVRKCWRTLVQFLNVDLGRREERAIHRKKDEVIKLLQEARNLLIQNAR